MAHHVPPEAPPGVAPEAPAVPAAPLPLGQPRNYRELLSNEAIGPRRDRLANYFNGYRFEGGGLPAPTTLREQMVVLSDRQPIAFLCLVAGACPTREVILCFFYFYFSEVEGK